MERNLAGVECLSGIPGSVGGTPVQNVGAYGQEVSETIVSVLAFDLDENRVRELNATECGFSYRSSIFNSTQRGRYIILRVSYALTPEGSPRLLYADLQKYFAGREGTPTLPQVREAVRRQPSSRPRIDTSKVMVRSSTALNWSTREVAVGVNRAATSLQRFVRQARGSVPVPDRVRV